MLCIAGTDGYFKRLNQAFSETLGYSHEELRSIPIIDFIHKDDVQSTLAAIAKQSAGNSITGFENRYRCKDGSYKWMSWKSVPIGNVMYGCGRDVTETHERRENLLSIIKVQTAIANANFNKKKILSIAVEQARDLTSASGAMFNSIENNEFTFSAISNDETDLLGVRNPLTTGLSGKAVQEKKTIYSSDTEADQRVHRPFQTRFNIHSAIFTPLIYRDVSEGVLLVYSSKKNAFDEKKSAPSS
jgi:PAS domain S-box-containing protein